MYNYIVGQIACKSEGQLVLEAGGIGYEMAVSNQTLGQLPMQGEIVKIYTFLKVTENDIYLYGFFSKEEKEMFLLLNKVDGIGPKAALGVLSSLPVPDIAKAIASEDVKRLSMAKGLGKKTAEKIIVMLKDQVGILGCPSSQSFSPVKNSNIDDAVEILSSLGLTKSEAYRLASACATDETSAEQIVARALKTRGGR